MDEKYLLLACILCAVSAAVSTELNKSIIKKSPERGKDVAKKRITEKSSQFTTTNEKYTEEKSDTSGKKKEDDEDVDYPTSDKDGKKKYTTYSTSGGKTGKGKSDEDTGYKGDDKGEKDDGGDKKNYKDYGDDGGSDDRKWKESSSGRSASSAASGNGMSSGIRCSIGVKFIPHPSDCTKFYQCAHLYPFLLTCPSGLYFNPRLDLCDWPSNVDCSSGNSRGSSYEPSHSSGYGPSYESNNKASYEPPMYDNNKSGDDQSTFSQPKYYSDSKSWTDTSKYPTRDQQVNPIMPSSQDRQGVPQLPFISPQFLPVHFPVIPVIHAPIYQPMIPVHQGRRFKYPQYSPDQHYDDKSYVDDKEYKKEEESADQKTKDDNVPQPPVDDGKSSDKTGVDDGKTNGQIVKKVFVRRRGNNKDTTSTDKSDDKNNKRLYYYYYYDDNNNKDNNKDNSNQKQFVIKDRSRKDKVYYYYDYGGNSGKTKDRQDYGNKKYYYDYGSDYDYGYDYIIGGKKAQDIVSIDKQYNKRKGHKSSDNYEKEPEISDEELGILHFNHMGHGSKSKSSGGGLGDIGSILPLLLLGGGNGGQQLLMTSLLLSKFKSGGSGGLSGSKSKSGEGKDDLLNNIILLSLLSGNGNTNQPTTPVSAPNVQIVNGQFVSIATGQPAILIDSVTGQPVTPAQTSVNPTTGQLIVTATGSPVFLQDPVTGTLQVAIVGTAGTVPGNPIVPAPARRGFRRRVLVPSTSNRFVPLLPATSTQNTAGTTTGHDSVNLIFLSPLTPASIPPAINNNDGSATLIRGSLRDILGPNLASFINNVPLVPGQGPPNSVAGSKQACNVVRSGETVPFRISPRNGRLLPSECDAIGKLLDKFVPTFLQNFVPSEAAFAGFGSSSSNSARSSSSIPGTSSFQPSAADSDSLFSGASSNPNNSNIRNNNNFNIGGSINDFINVRNDQNGCTIAVPNIVPQC